MKKIAVLFTFLLLLSCNSKKDFTKVTEGMSPEDVVKTVGEPTKKTNILFGDIWMYETHVVTISEGKVAKVITKEEFEKGMGEMMEGLHEADQKIKEGREKWDSLQNAN